MYPHYPQELLAKLARFNITQAPAGLQCTSRERSIYNNCAQKRKSPGARMLIPGFFFPRLLLQRRRQRGESPAGTPGIASGKSRSLRRHLHELIAIAARKKASWRCGELYGYTGKGLKEDELDDEDKWLRGGFGEVAIWVYFGCSERDRLIWNESRLLALVNFWAAVC